jgi:hypothetical protein
MARSSYFTDNDENEPALPCSEKLAFDTLREAMAAANVAEYQHGAQVRPYECLYCGLWHLTTS